MPFAPLQNLWSTAILLEINITFGNLPGHNDGFALDLSEIGLDRVVYRTCICVAWKRHVDVAIRKTNNNLEDVMVLVSNVRPPSFKVPRYIALLGSYKTWLSTGCTLSQRPRFPLHPWGPTTCYEGAGKVRSTPGRPSKSRTATSCRNAAYQIGMSRRRHMDSPRFFRGTDIWIYDHEPPSIGWETIPYKVPT